jgi:hypothetical protein
MNRLSILFDAGVMTCRRGSPRGIVEDVILIAVAECRAIKRKPARSGVISNIYRISSLILISVLESEP